MTTTPTTPEQARAEQERVQKRIAAYDDALAEVRRQSDERTAHYEALVKAAEEKGEEWPAIPDQTPEHRAAWEAWTDAQKDLPDPTLAAAHIALLGAYAEALARWIPVEERLPEKGVDVWFYTLGGNMLIGALNGGFMKSGSFLYDTENVTHWQPLPTPPAQAPASAEGGVG